MMATIINDINKAIAGRYPIIYLHTKEEERAIAAVKQAALERLDSVPVISWSCTAGFDNDPTARETRDAVAALNAIIEAANPGFYVMKDLSEFMLQPVVARSLHDVCTEFAARGDFFIFVVAPTVIIPELLRSEVYVVDVEPPDAAELLAQLHQVLTEYPGVSFNDGALKDIACLMSGLALKDASHIMHQVCNNQELKAVTIREYINTYKKKIATSDAAACLEYMPVTMGIDQVGGLNYLKEWVLARKRLFSSKSQAEELPIPRGILIMGISGCGKSMCAKVIANTWQVPLFRLDMNLIFSQLYGNPEAAFHKAVHTIEAAAPAVLWIDEIENGLGLLEGGNTNQSHIFSAFLTWMQEKPPLVFVAATANQIEALPAELIRKGRFDQVFFCDLPDARERAEILTIHIRANKQNPADFDIGYLAKITKDWNAAEIEQAIQGGRIYAENKNRPFTTADIAKYIETIVPLSETMSEQIKKIRDWAWDRATPASRGKGKGRELSFSDEG
jgi:adenylate kinase family enzyme